MTITDGLKVVAAAMRRASIRSIGRPEWCRITLHFDNPEAEAEFRTLLRSEAALSDIALTPYSKDGDHPASVYGVPMTVTHDRTIRPPRG